MRIHLTAGICNDIVPASVLIEGVPAEKLFVDKAYDDNEPSTLAERQSCEVIIVYSANAARTYST